MRRRWIIVPAAALGMLLAAGVMLMFAISDDHLTGPTIVSGLRPAIDGQNPPQSAEVPAPPAPITPQPVMPRRVAPPAEIVTSAPPAADPAASGPMPRIVGGPGISPGPIVNGQMERETPPAPAALTPAAAADSGPAWQAFTQVVVIGAGTLNLGGRKVILAGLQLPEGDQRCRVDGGSEITACSFLSMQALRQRLRARGVECRVDGLETSGIEPVACRLGTADLGEWLVGQGWASAAADAPEAYRAAEDAARCAGAGLWADAPRPDSCPAQ